MTHVATQEFSKRTVDAYVDDADLYATGKESKIILNEEDGAPEDTSNDNAVWTTKNVGKAAQKFSNLVRIIGQHKASHKCGYQISAWWKNRKGRLVPRDTSKINEKIQIEDHKGIKTKIKKMNIKETNKGLGFFINPLGTQTDEFKFRVAQAKYCATQINQTRLTQYEAWITYLRRVLPKVTYLFVATRFTVKQLHKLAVIIDNVILPKMKINRKTPKAVVYGPKEYGEIKYPYIGTI